MLRSGRPSRYGGGSEADRRAVATHAPRRCSVDFHELSIIDIGAERLLDGFKVGPVSVGRELHLVSEPETQIVHEREGIFGIASANEIGDNQLAIWHRPGGRSTPASTT